MLRNAVVLGISFALLRDPSCGGGVEPTSSGVNAPCTRPKDCRAGLTCEKGVCTETGDADPTPPPDGGGPARDAGDGG